MTHHCPDCDAIVEAAGGLCDDCIEDCYWIVRPAAHRETTRRTQAAMATLYRHRGVEIITALPERNDLWICDICNAPIPVAGDIHLIPAVGSYALCGMCVTGVVGWPYAFNPPRACPCLGCTPETARHPSHGAVHPANRCSG
jgi:hypothetical protein